jgi:hypothetical protein
MPVTLIVNVSLGLILALDCSSLPPYILRVIVMAVKLAATTHFYWSLPIFPELP